MTNNKLDPNWVTGFTDAEGCFMINITKRKTNKLTWKIQPCFQIKLHIKDKDLLLKIKLFFNEAGNIVTNYNHNFVAYNIYNIKYITNIIIPHFNNYQLITQKQSDFIIFKNIVELINKDEHLTKDGLIKIINLKASLNKGLSDKLKTNFPNITKVERSKVNIPIIIDYNWIAGFMSGDGCFSVGIYKSSTNKIGYGVALQIILTQHSRDEILFNKIKNLLGCGFIYEYPNRNIIKLNISNFKYIYNKMIPLFNKHKIIGVKLLDYLDFCKVTELINKKAHLTKDGLEKICKIKYNMNKNRKN
jgi:hypothetical protein